MDSLVKASGWAALVVALAFAMHNLNGAWIEPRLLGFGEYGDYARLDKLKNASRAWPWLASGIGHVATGFAMVVLALGALAAYGERRPAAARIAFAAGLLSAAGFLLLGLSHVIGRQSLFLLGDANPALRESAYMTATVVRIVFNRLAQVALGSFAIALSWCGLRTRTLPASFCGYGYLSGAAGLLMAVAYIPVYLYTVLVWAAWLAIVLLVRPLGAGAARAVP
jgi:hypothetical protein